jgi:hypothetical protein
VLHSLLWADTWTLLSATTTVVCISFHIPYEVTCYIQISAVFSDRLECRCKIWGLHGGEDWSQGLLGCDAVQGCGRIPTFRRNLLSPTQRWRLEYCSLTRSKQHWRQREQVPPKRRYPTTTLHGVTVRKTSTWIFTAVKMSTLSFFKTSVNFSYS